MIRKALLTTAVAALPFLGLAACSDSTAPDGSATLNVELTDAPSADVERAWVKVDRLTLQGTDGEVVLLDESTDYIQLTELVSTTETLVEDEVVPEGSYGQLRFHIAGAAVETEEGDVFSLNGAAEELELDATGDLICPSCGETGIKVNTPEDFRLEAESKILVLDFDVNESFGREAGGSGTWVMEPVITSSDIEASGTIAGSIETESGVEFPTCNGTERSVEDFVPRALDQETGDVVKSGNVASDGSYEIRFLSPDDYDVGYAGTVELNSDELEFEASPSQATATVQSGAETTVDYTITAVGCPISN